MSAAVLFFIAGHTVLALLFLWAVYVSITPVRAPLLPAGPPADAMFVERIKISPPSVGLAAGAAVGKRECPSGGPAGGGDACQLPTRSQRYVALLSLALLSERELETLDNPLTEALGVTPVVES